MNHAFKLSKYCQCVGCAIVSVVLQGNTGVETKNCCHLMVNAMLLTHLLMLFSALKQAYVNMFINK